MEDVSNGVEVTRNEDHGWKTVSYQKKGRKQPQQKQQQNGHPTPAAESNGDRKTDVFRAIVQEGEGRNRKYTERQKAAAAATGDLSMTVDHGSDEEGSSDADGAPRAENGATEEKKSKPKKPKKPKVTVSEAAFKLDSSDLAAFLAEISVSYETQQDIQLMRFADYFGRAFSKVGGAQFPWLKMLKESPVAKMVDIPLANISDSVYKTSTDWLNQRSTEALGSFVLWALESIFSDQALHQGSTKSAKKVVQQASSKSQVAVFLVLAMVLRRKPDVLISLLPILNENTKYQGQDKLPVLVWVITQASQGDLVVGLLMWVQFLFPLLISKSNFSQQSRDSVFQVVERIISSHKARTVLINGAVRKGERVVPPSSLELLVRSTYSSNSAQGKTTERLRAVYPILKEVALAVSPGSKAAKQICQQILPFAINAAGEGNSDLANEASDIFIWCLTTSPDSFKQWDIIYMQNLVANVIILKKLSVEWKVLSMNPSTLEPLKSTLKSFISKNEKALALEEYEDKTTLKEAQKHCKVLLSRVSRGNGCLKAFILLSAVAVGVGAAVFTSNDDVKKMLEEFDVKKMLEEFDVKKMLEEFDVKKMLEQFNINLS